MKPLARIRKTIMWGSAALTVLLLVVWIGSGWWRGAHWSVGGVVSVALDDGRACIQCDALKQASTPQEVIEGPRITERGYIHLHYENEPTGVEHWFSGGTTSRGWWLHVPLWLSALASLGITALAFRLDTLARRRARMNLCPKCHYDRTGLAGDAVCPECGTGSGGETA